MRPLSDIKHWMQIAENIGATAQEVDAHRKHANDRLLDIAENTGQNKMFTVQPALHPNVLVVEFSKGSHVLSGKKIWVKKQGTNTAVRGIVSSTHYAYYSVAGVLYTSSQLDTRVYLGYVCDSLEHATQRSIEIDVTDAYPEIVEFAFQIAAYTGGVDYDDDEELDEFIEDVASNTDFDLELAKQDALEEIELFRELVGSDYEEIDRHRMRPHDRMLDISENARAHTTNEIRKYISILENASDHHGISINAHDASSVELEIADPTTSIPGAQYTWFTASLPKQPSEAVIEGTICGNYLRNANVNEPLIDEILQSVDSSVSLPFVVNTDGNLQVFDEEISAEYLDELVGEYMHATGAVVDAEYVHETMYDSLTVDMQQAEADVANALEYIYTHVGSTYDEVQKRRTRPSGHLIGLR